MKHTQTIRFLIGGLLVLAFTGACSPAQDARAVKIASNAADEIALAASRAARAAEEVQIAEQAAKTAKNAEEAVQLLRKADEAAQQARQAAEEARGLQQAIEDLKLQQQVAADVQRAENSAESAKFSQAQIDEIINSCPPSGSGPPWIALSTASPSRGEIQRRPGNC
jgi:hypothetical protein